MRAVGKGDYWTRADPRAAANRYVRVRVDVGVDK